MIIYISKKDNAGTVHDAVLKPPLSWWIFIMGTLKMIGCNKIILCLFFQPICMNLFVGFVNP